VRGGARCRGIVPSGIVLFAAGLVAAAWVGVAVSPAGAWTPEEHRALTLEILTRAAGGAPYDSAGFPGLPEGAATVLAAGQSFQALCGLLAPAGFTAADVQTPGRTVLQQLRQLPASRIDRCWRTLAAIDDAPPGDFLEALRRLDRAENAPANFLLRHLAALRFARRAARGGPAERERDLTRAWLTEAAALGYLTDAMAAGRLLVPLADPLARFHGVNTRVAATYYGDFGVYVVDSLGDAWRAFGDGHLFWFWSNLDRVASAGGRAVAELLAAYETPDASDSAPFAPHEGSGDRYYTDLRLLSLRSLPMPAPALWSFWDGTLDEHGVPRRRRILQLRDPGLHDPSLEGDLLDHLPRAAAMPPWLRPDLSRSTGGPLHSAPTSVRNVQNRALMPSRAGLLLAVGGGATLSEGRGFDRAVAFGAGYARHFRFLVADGWIVPRLHYSPGFRRGDGDLWNASLGFGTAGLETHRLVLPELGYGWTTAGERGVSFALGIDAATVRLPVTYAAVSLRTTLQVVLLEDAFAALFLEAEIQ